MTKLPRQLTVFSSALVLAVGSAHSFTDNAGISFAIGPDPRLASFALLFTHMLHSHVRVTEAAVFGKPWEANPANEGFPVVDDENFYEATTFESGRSQQDRFAKDKNDEEQVEDEKEEQKDDYGLCSECLCQALPRKVLAELNPVYSRGSSASSFRSEPPRIDVPESANSPAAKPDSTPETAGHEHLYAAPPVRPLAVSNDVTHAGLRKRGLAGMAGAATFAFVGGFGVGLLPPAIRTVRFMVGRCRKECSLTEVREAAKGELEQYCKVRLHSRRSSSPEPQEKVLGAAPEERFFKKLLKVFGFEKEQQEELPTPSRAQGSLHQAF